MQDLLHEAQKTINWFQLGLNFIIEATHHEIKTTINWFQLVLQLIIETNQTWFQAGLHSNLLILNVLGDHFWTFWNPGRPRWHQFGDHLVPGFTQQGSWASQCRFVSILMNLGCPSGTLLANFLVFYVNWDVKKHVWIAGTIFNDFWSTELLISDVRTTQKHSKYCCFR